MRISDWSSDVCSSDLRHPLYAGFIIAFWATPEMTLGHMLFSVGMTIYILIAIPYEERDLVGALGDDYASYRGRGGMLFPRLRRAPPRSEERRVGKECDGTCRSRRSPDH